MSETDQHAAMTITVGSESFPATMGDTETARAFRDLLPLTLDMHDVNGNEKAYDLPSALPNSPTNPAQIQAGDLMLYGSGTLVLFYESFATQYTYTRIGRVTEPDKLARAVGSGDAEVTFSAER